jgi:hypothetical protein
MSGFKPVVVVAQGSDIFYPKKSFKTLPYQVVAIKQLV